MRAPFLSFLLLMTATEASAAASLSEALAQHDWETSLALAQRLDGVSLERQALPYAQGDVVPAMWLMGQARYLQQDLIGASRWFYRGWVGLQVDLSLCRMPATQTRPVVDALMNSFPTALAQVRETLPVRTAGVKDAATYYAGHLDRDAHPGWSCSWALQHGHKTKPEAVTLVSADRFPTVRNRAFKIFLRDTGLGSVTATTDAPSELRLETLP